MATGFPDPSLKTNFFEAVKANDLAKVTEILDQFPGEINVVSDDFNTPLSLASTDGQIDMVRLLLARGADVRLPPTSPPIVAATFLNYEGGIVLRRQIIPILLNEGHCDPSLVGSESGRSALSMCCGDGDEETLALLISRGAELNRPDSDGTTPLLFAIYNDQAGCAKLLIKAGVAMPNSIPGVGPDSAIVAQLREFEAANRK